MSKYSKKIEFLEREGLFHEDLLPYRTDNMVILNGDYDYRFSMFHEKVFRAVLTALLYAVVPPVLFFGCGLKVKGKEKLKGVKGGIIITNHAHYLDCVMVNTLAPHSKLFHTGAAFNNKKGIRGAFLKLIGFLPLNGSYGAQKNLMKRMEELLNAGCFIQFYPEQAMWPYYKKARPFKEGAFKYAVRFDKPIIPTFITFESTPFRRFFKMKERCVLNVLDPIYPNKEKEYREGIEELKNRSFSSFVNCYEETYKIPHKYQK